MPLQIRLPHHGRLTSAAPDGGRSSSEDAFPRQRDYPAPRRAHARRSWLRVDRSPMRLRFLRCTNARAQERRCQPAVRIAKDPCNDAAPIVRQRTGQTRSQERFRTRSHTVVAQTSKSGVSPLWLRRRDCNSVPQHTGGNLPNNLGNAFANPAPTPRRGFIVGRRIPLPARLSHTTASSRQPLLTACVHRPKAHSRASAIIARHGRLTLAAPDGGRSSSEGAFPCQRDYRAPRRVTLAAPGFATRPWLAPAALGCA